MTINHVRTRPEASKWIPGSQSLIELPDDNPLQEKSVYNKNYSRDVILGRSDSEGPGIHINFKYIYSFNRSPVLRSKATTAEDDDVVFMTTRYFAKKQIKCPLKAQRPDKLKKVWDSDA